MTPAEMVWTVTLGVFLGQVVFGLLWATVGVLATKWQARRRRRAMDKIIQMYQERSERIHPNVGPII